MWIVWLKRKEPASHTASNQNYTVFFCSLLLFVQSQWFGYGRWRVLSIPIHRHTGKILLSLFYICMPIDGASQGHSSEPKDLFSSLSVWFISFIWFIKVLIWYICFSLFNSSDCYCCLIDGNLVSCSTVTSVGLLLFSFFVFTLHWNVFNCE